MKSYKLLLCCFLFLSSQFLSGQNKKATSDSNKLKTILFVCEHGSARSTIAAAYFNKIANEKGLRYKAIFRATNPDITFALTPATKKGLESDGFDTKFMRPILVTQKDIDSAKQIITFDCTLPPKDSSNSEIQKWNGIPPISKSYQIARNEIVIKVESLINSLDKKRKKQK